MQWRKYLVLEMSLLLALLIVNYILVISEESAFMETVYVNSARCTVRNDVQPGAYNVRQSPIIRDTELRGDQLPRTH